MGDLLDEDDALEANNILYRCLDFLLDRKATLFSHAYRVSKRASPTVLFSMMRGK
jgi:hypothetical protein